MIDIVSANIAKKIDNYTITEIGIPSIVLMENAAEKIYNSILHKGDSFAVFCGSGNNGGDGLAIARKLINHGMEVTIIIFGDTSSTSEEFKINYNILNNLHASIINFHENKDRVLKVINNSQVIVDAIFGVGINREIKGDFYQAIKAINKSSSKIISVDIPSGLNSDTGEIHGICIKATETFTIEVYKKGFLVYEAQKYLGIINLVNIGIPMSVKEKFSEGIKILDKNEYSKIVPRRSLYGHKGDYGKVLILAGSKSYTGAAYITTEACVNMGSGLVTLMVEDEIRNILLNKITEAMLIGYSEKEKIKKIIEEADVIACGPGLSTNTVNVKMLIYIIENTNCKIVLDADALNIISNHKELLKKLKNRAVITPHPGEMARLIGRDISYVERNRIKVCKEFSLENNIITVLKGYNTVISNGYETIINTTGSSKMASGGMGDCLTGIISSLIGQKVDLFESGILGVYVHGLTGDIIGKNKFSIKAGDIISNISFTLENLKNIE